MMLRFLAGTLVLAPSIALAQFAAPPTLQPPVAAPAMTNAVLRTGTEVPLRLVEELTTKGKQLRVGQRFRLQVAEGVVVQGATVIPVGSPAIGEITDVRNKGMWGKSGHLAARILYVTVNGRQIHLSGAFDDKGVAGGVGAVAVSSLVFLPAGFFMTGTSAHLPAGTQVKGFVDEDVPLNFAAGALPALPVSGAAPVVYPAVSAVAPAAAGGLRLIPARTPSGFCVDAPANYQGTGASNAPAITSAQPLCR